MIRKFVILVLLLALAWVGSGWWTVHRMGVNGVHDSYYLIVPSPIPSLSLYLAEIKQPGCFRSPSGIIVTIPFWLASVSLAMYPALALWEGPFRRFVRRRRGHCVKCDYNLAGNTTGVCPECGTKCEPKLA